MGVLQNYEGPEGWERWSWEHTIAETHPSNPLVKGRRPEFPQLYPAMLYKVTNRNPLKLDCVTVGSENEERTYISQGYVAGGPACAVDEYDNGLNRLAKAAAERAFHEQRMSPQAQAEAEAVDLTTIKHLGEIPETPIKRRGRPRKVQEPNHA